jgi:hypothetical protein
MNSPRQAADVRNPVRSGLEHFVPFWNILGTKPTVLGVFFSAFQK